MPPNTDATDMKIRLRRIAILALVPWVAGCLMPSTGTPVFVDVGAGDFWSGNGLLTEVSEDQKRCRVSVRDRTLVVRDLWVDCPRVHSPSAR
jgi:hypothetical protein